MSDQIKNNLIKSYDYDAHRRSAKKRDEWKVVERMKFTNMLLQEDKTRLLEIGAGAGIDSLHFMNHNLRVTAIDLSTEMVKICSRKGIDARVMDLYHLGFPKESFDSIYAMNCLLHVPKDEIHQVLVEIKRVMKGNGLFYLGIYGGKNFEGIWEEDWCEPKRFFSFYTEEDIHSLLRHYFDIEYYNKVILKTNKPYFQSFILRNKTTRKLESNE
ncbi:class I SAM-dependent methyltransferase [Caldalkalibacillus salinus]|uniref:class I SAM-dependent methyltransferase n=1 Tax=Caldalkalibacillus salinus TaxID=2803787 RepID=UPI0019234A9C|nr:class I SAM-dependent methyltransferase [Caldalkalibacillus salinus]